MSVGLTPDPALREFTDLGVVAPGALLLTLVSGTPATNLATYSDTIGTPNTNPVVASAGGLFGPIYLVANVAYRLICKTAAGVVIWDRDPVTSAGGAGSVGASSGTNDFRLTLESGVPVSPTDQLAKTTLYLTPSGRGNRIDLFDAAGALTTIASAQVSIALPAVASQVYDVFAWNNAGVVTLELLAWTNDTTRATALTLATTGCYTKTGDLTRRYLGSVRTTTVAGQTEDSTGKRYVYNAANRAARVVRRLETAVSWAYTTATYRQANANGANQVEIVQGLAEDAIALVVMATLANVTAAPGTAGSVAIGEDSTTTPATGALYGVASSVANALAQPTAALHTVPAVGRHTYVWLEFSAATGASTWFGANVPNVQSGIAGHWRC
jgi:hypothetical protein